MNVPLINLLDPDSPWFKLANSLPWPKIERELAAYFDAEAQPSRQRIRLMVGLLIMGKLYKEMSDEKIVKHWPEYPIWQYLCGETEFQHKAPCTVSELRAFRERIGEDGGKFIFDICDSLYEG